MEIYFARIVVAMRSAKDAGVLPLLGAACIDDSRRFIVVYVYQRAVLVRRLAGAMARYVEATGKPSLFPRWTTGFWQSKNRYSNTTEVRKR